MKILVITPNIKHKGGVSIFNSLLFDYSKNDLTLFTLNSNRKDNLHKPFYLTKDYLAFVIQLISNKYNIIQINPSLARNAIFRDALFILIAKYFKRKVLVQWHGWNEKNEYLLKSFLFKEAFYKVDHMRFLTSESQKKMISSGFKNSTSIGNTFVEDNLIDTLETRKYSNKKEINILFLARISIEKGILIALKTFELANKEFNNLILTIAGDGPDLKYAKQYVMENNIKNVQFIGRVEGDEKITSFKTSDIYLFPSYTEGMPISLLEAMLFGNVIITSDVGGIKDFFEQGKMGFMIHGHEPSDYFERLCQIIRLETRDKISQYNTQFIKNKFIASKSVKEIDKIYKNVIK